MYGGTLNLCRISMHIRMPLTERNGLYSELALTVNYVNNELGLQDFKSSVKLHLHFLISFIWDRNAPYTGWFDYTRIEIEIHLRKSN